MRNETTIKVDISNPYPSSQEVYSHELNSGLARFINVAFYDNSLALDFTNVDVRATIVCNGYLVAEDIPQPSITNNVVSMNISSTANYTILAGIMYIEFKFSQTGVELYPPIPIVINVKKSIRDDAQVTPESYGTVSEILQEVAEARGSYNSLDDRLDDIENHFPVKSYDIDSGAVIQGKLGTGAVTLNNIAVSAIDTTPTSGSDKLLTSGGAYTALLRKMNFLNLGVNDFALVVAEGEIYQIIEDNIQYYAWVIGDIQYRTSVNGLEYREYNNNTHSWGFWASAIADGSITIDALAGGLLITSTSQQVLYDDYHLPTTRFMKNDIDTRVLNPDYSLGFDTDGVIKVRADTTTISATPTGLKSLYAAPKCVNITGTPSSDLTDIYVDNYSENVNIDTSITSESRITIHYRGSFKLIDLLTASQLALANRVGQANTIIENALNGVS